MGYVLPSNTIWRLFNVKALILVDRLNWAYHSIALACKKYNTSKHLKIDIIHIKGNVKKIKKIYKKYDLFFVMGWQTYNLVNFLPKSATLTGLHSFHSWDDRRTTPDTDVTPPDHLVEFLNSFKGVNAVSLRLTSLFKKSGVKNIHYTPNGVDTDIFKNYRKLPLDDTLTVGYSGSKSHDWRKGVTEFIKPAAKKSNVKIKIAMRHSGDYVPLEQMYKFYNSIDCYICASQSEGMSLSVLEAAACGRPIIGTRVSGNVDIIKDGMTGFLINRDVESISKKIDFLKNVSELKKMSNAIENDVIKNWCWSYRVKSWIDFIKD